MAQPVSQPTRRFYLPLAIHKPIVKDVEISLLAIGIIALGVGALSHFGILQGFNAPITYSFLGGGGGTALLSSSFFYLSKRRRTDTHAPPNEKVKQADDQKKEEFKRRALTTFKRQELQGSRSLPDVDSEIQSEAIAVLEERTLPNRSVKSGSGGRTRWVSHEAAPDVLWKKAKKEEYTFTDKHQEVVRTAQQICEENDLYLLYVPTSELLKDGVLLQEKVELQEENGRLTYQRGLFRWALDQPDMQDYMHELLRQLTVFICESGFADVKYDNIALTKDGRIALFDLDNKSAPIGLIQGEARRAFGLFGMIPKEWFEEFQELAKNHGVDLKKTDNGPQWIKKHRAKAKQRASRREVRKNYYEKRGVVAANQPLHIPKNLDANLKKVLEYINTELNMAHNYDLLSARKIRISYSPVNEFWKEIGINNEEEFSTKFSEYLEELKSLGFLIYAKKKETNPKDPNTPSTLSFKIMV